MLTDDTNQFNYHFLSTPSALAPIELSLRILESHAAHETREYQEKQKWNLRNPRSSCSEVWKLGIFRINLTKVLGIVFDSWGTGSFDTTTLTPADYPFLEMSS